MLSFGSDPEVMLADRNGEFVSAIPILNANKENKIDFGNGCKVFYDNVLLEMNIKPETVLENFLNNVRLSLSSIQGKIYPCKILIQSSANYPLSQLTHDDAKVFGCEPEFCAYDLSQIVPPTCEDGNPFRSAGGHIHLGDTEEIWPLRAPCSEEDTSVRDWGRIWIVRMLDLFLGVPSVLMDNNKYSILRRRLYGKAGTHRPKDYGVEYRPLSNFWLLSPRLVTVVWKIAHFVYEFVKENRHKELWKDENTCVGYDVAQVRNIIDSSNGSAARKLMESTLKKYFPENLLVDIFQFTEPEWRSFINHAVEWKI